MPSVMAIISKSIFEKQARHDAKVMDVRDLYATKCYQSCHRALKPLDGSGCLFLVTVRPPGERLLLVAVLENPKFRGDRWESRQTNRCAILDVSHLVGKIRLANDKGLSARKGRLAMSLQTPRELAEADVMLLRSAMSDTRLSKSPQRASRTARRATLSRVAPPHIAESGIIGAPLKHGWNDDDPVSHYGKERPTLEGAISKLTDRATLALATGMAEWVAWRMTGLCDDQMLFHYLEAAWVANVDWRYLEPKDNPEENLPWAEWNGPVRGPLCAVASILSEIVDCGIEQEPASPETVYLSNVVKHVLPTRANRAYRDWFQRVLRRLTSLYPVDDDSPTGPPVPKEAVDPDFDFDPRMTNRLFNRFLKSLDYRRNPYLRSPSRVRKAGFKGEPYQLR